MQANHQTDVDRGLRVGVRLQRIIHLLGVVSRSRTDVVGLEPGPPRFRRAAAELDALLIQSIKDARWLETVAAPLAGSLDRRWPHVARQMGVDSWQRKRLAALLARHGGVHRTLRAARRQWTTTVRALRRDVAALEGAGTGFVVFGVGILLWILGVIVAIVAGDSAAGRAVATTLVFVGLGLMLAAGIAAIPTVIS